MCGSFLINTEHYLKMINDQSNIEAIYKKVDLNCNITVIKDMKKNSSTQKRISLKSPLSIFDSFSRKKKL